MEKLFHQLRTAEKNLEATRILLRNSQDDLLAERKRNIELNQKLCASISREQSEHGDRVVYQVGFWALSLLCVAYVFFVALNP